MLRVGVTGVCGRMGGRIAALICEADDLLLASVLEFAGHPRQGTSVREIIPDAPAGLVVAAEMPAALDVLIDFSAPEVTVGYAAACAAHGVALVAGTTGMTPEQLQRLREAARRTPCLWSANMSLGVNLLCRVTEMVARALGPDYDVEIVEMHHRFKKDSPSGTARMLAESAARGHDVPLRDKAVFGRQGIVGERPRGEIGIHAVRGGDVVGEHTVTFASLGERIELTHRAHSRDVFARGAIRAARFIAGKPPGFYTMNDVLGAK